MALTIAEGTKGWEDYSQGIAWGTIALAVAVVGGYFLLIAGIATDVVSLPVGMVIATIIIYLGFTVAHEAGHGNISHGVSWMKPYERMLGWAMNLLFLILPFGLFAKIHDNHHAFTNDPDQDPDHWVSGDTWLEASWRAMTLPLHYVYLTLTQLRNNPVIAETHKSSLVYYAVTTSIVVGLISVGLGWELLIIGVLPIFLASFFLGMLFDWIPHMPTRQQGRYQNTRSYLLPGLKFLTLGQNYHHIHHLYPRVPWYNYQRVFNHIRPELEAKNAPIEILFSKTKPGFGQSVFAQEPSSIDGVHKQTLLVERVEQETDQAVVITFAPTNGKVLPFKPGQYVTVSKLINGESVTRCYSICTSPSSNELSVGVKKVQRGQLSNYLNESLKAGDELTVTGPFGDFIFDPAVDQSSKPLVLIAGGSGITPVLSIAKTALESSPERRVNLIYANRSIQDAMFLTTLNDLKSRYADRFDIVHVLEKPHKDWDGYTGYLDDDKLQSMLTSFFHFEESLFYICGPDVMKNIVETKLNALELPADHIFIEEFAQAAPKAEGAVHQVNIELANGQTYALDVAENQTVLQVANQEGVKIPYACGVGQCGCCMMQVEEGDTILASEDTPGLLEDEKARGLTLACQCMPRSAVTLKV